MKKYTNYVSCVSLILLSYWMAEIFACIWHIGDQNMDLRYYWVKFFSLFHPHSSLENFGVMTLNFMGLGILLNQFLQRFLPWMFT